MKKILLICLMFFLSVFLTGCNIVKFTQDFVQEQRNSVDAEEKSIEISKNVFNAIKVKDILVIEDLFCDKVKNTYDLSSEIAKLFSVINGNVISYGDINENVIRRSLHFMTSANEYVKKGKIENIMTDKGNVYDIYITHYLSYVDESSNEYVGIHEIRVVSKENIDVNTEGVEILRVGEFFEFIRYQELPSRYVNLDNNSDYVSVNSYEINGKIIARNVILAIKEKNIQELYKIFARKYQNNELLSNIEGLFDFIDGNVISCGEIEVDRDSWENTEKYGVVKRTLHVTVYDVITDTGMMYEMEFYVDDVNKDSPLEVGISHRLIIKHVESKVVDFNHEVISKIEVDGNSN